MMVDSNIDDCNAVAHTGGWSLVSLGHTPWLFSPVSLIGISRHFPQVDKSNPDILRRVSTTSFSTEPGHKLPSSNLMAVIRTSTVHWGVKWVRMVQISDDLRGIHRD